MNKTTHLVNNMVMVKANVFEVKAKLSDYLDRTTRGERIVICRHNKPVAELRAIQEVRTKPRPIGPLPGRPTFEIPASFFEPLSADELDLWDGVTPTYALSPEAKGGVSKVAEAKADSTTRRAHRPARRRS